MLTAIRKIDLIAQAFIGLLSIASIAVLQFMLLFSGQFILGVLQVASALLNTPAMLRSTYRVRIQFYWLLTILALIPWLTPSDTLKTISVFISWGIAIYYWFMYKSFQEYIAYRKELSTVIRHH
ncbi:MAG TPA: hypothetical protein VHL77_08335 [Ferruginibacter sp.]|jgi:hypothetical protein|nr:hypothetical protein [Ferruginibacter sp.]